MDEKKKSLLDNPEGNLILNESGTSVSMDSVNETPATPANTKQQESIEEDARGDKYVKGDES